MPACWKATTYLIAAAALQSAAAAEAPLTARQVIEKIQQHAGGPWHGATVDTFKAGDPDTPVTGIATTFADTYDVLERAAAAGANLVISHEPTFYNHLDETKLLTNDPVYQAKLAFITQHKMVVFRFHDHWHHPVMKPDGIMTGEIHALGWEKYHQANDEMMFVMPETTLDSLAASIQQKIGIRTMRVIGDPKMKLKRVALIPGAAGADRQIQALERQDVDVLVVGESREWETVEYARDAVSQHRTKALIVMGHVVSEEAGMDYCATWLKQFLPGIPIKFLPAGEPFWTPKAAR
jgi:putative NIF3 family GTP cyclohydrolase 1 type 2